MSMTDAVGFLERLESDEPFARELEALKDNPNAVYGKVKAAGFDAQPEEIREAFAERYGAELTPEQLDQIAAGMDPGDIAGIAVGSLAILGTVVGIGAIAAGC
ncbi:MAG: Nif11-like leader peptide family RiPP precursor [Solirubrobacteraceae bacterium]